MAKRKKSGITEDERFVIDDFIGGIEQLGEYLEDDGELPVVDDMGEDAQEELLQRIHQTLGDDKLYRLREILSMADDPDFRCPK